MDSKANFPLSSSDQVNPLRPYHRASTIGSLPAAQAQHTARPNVTSSSASSLGSSARDLLPELDLDFKSSAGEAWQHTRSLFDALLYRYMSVCLAQPFDVAKVVLQVSLPPSAATATPQKRRTSPRSQAYANGRDGSRHGRVYEDTTDDDEAEDTEETGDESDGIPEYFSSTAPRSRSPRKRRRMSPGKEELSPTPRPNNRREQDPELEYKLRLKRPDSVTHAVSALYNTSGAVGLWRGTNCTFLYSVLLRTTDSFIRSLLLAVLGLPDIVGPTQSGLAPTLGVPGSMGFSGLDLSDSPNPIGSLIVVGLSSCIAGILLSPLDQVRTRLMITPTSHPPRGLVHNLRKLPSLLAPQSLWLPTTLAHTIPQIFSAATPLILRRQLKVTPESAPSLWSLAAFCTCLTDLFIRLPLETVVRRAQVASLKRADPDMPTVMEPASYNGIGGTVYSILYLEGETRTKDAKGMVRIRKGQGASGLIRGWRVGFWGLVGVWGAGAMGPGEGKGRGEF